MAKPSRSPDRSARRRARVVKQVDRAVHLQQAKDRALRYVAEGQYIQAIVSMQADLGRHPDTATHPARLSGIYQTSTVSVREWVESIV